MKEKILIIEDEEDIRNNIKELLALIDYEVITSENGEKGFQLAQKILPDLIISDILMPEMDGYELFEALQQNPQTRLIPFIFLTAKADIPDIRKGMQLGADDYIVKPFSSNDIIKSVRTRLNRAKQFREEKRNKRNTYEYDESILLTSSGNPHLINIKDIVYIEAQNQYCNIFLNNQSKITVRKSLREWENTLPQNIFIRIHRSTIVNKNFINKIEKWYKNSFIVNLKDNKTSLPVSQRYSSKLRKQFS